MKFRLTIIFIFAIAGNLFADNLLKYGDFELGNGISESTIRSSWTKIMSGYDLVTRSPQQGRYCIEFSKGGAAYVYTGKLKPKETIYLSFFARSTGFPTNAPHYRNSCVIWALTANGKRIGREKIISIKNSNEWRQYIQAIKIPDGTAKLKITLLKYKHAGTTWIDNVTLSRTQPNMSQGQVKAQTRAQALHGVTKELIRATRHHWFDETQGENLALGKPVQFSMKPNYSLTKNIQDSIELTDGKLCEGRKDGAIWFARDTVGWSGGTINQSGVNMTIDLGKTVSVDKVVIRMLAGKAQARLEFPPVISVYASNDNRNYYKIKTMRKFQPGDNSDNNSSGFELDESGTPYVYPLAFKNLNIKARYIGLNVKAASTFMFCDEIAIMKGNNATQSINLTKLTPALFFMKGIALKNNTGKLIISSNMVTPNFFQVIDQRRAQDKRKTLQYVFELPQQIDLLDNKYRGELVSKTPITVDGKKYIRWITKKPRSNASRGIAGPFYFMPNSKLTDKYAKAYIYLKSPGYESRKKALPIKLITIPTVPAFKKFSISLAWLLTGHLADWPTAISTMKQLGFNTIPTFHYNYDKGPDTPAAKLAKSLLADTRAAGLKVLYNDSPTHAMLKKHKKAQEIYHQVPGKKSKKLCPLYRGEFYRQEIARTARGIIATKPDIAFYDIESFSHCLKLSKNCTRCTAEAKKRGITLKELMTQAGTELLGDLHQAVKAACKKHGFKMPQIGLYANNPHVPVYHDVFDWKIIYAKGYVDFAMPSLYVRAQTQTVHKIIADNYRKLGNKRKSIPWLTTGTYGEFPAEKIEPMLYEVFFSGASGLTYFAYQDFDSPLDFFYHAKALKTIQPYENILWNGKLIKLDTDNKQLSISAWQLDNEMVIMVRNYRSQQTINGNILLPTTKQVAIKNIQTDKTFKDNGIAVKLNYLDYNLFYVKGL
jgi:hypothetical protein